MFTTRYRLTKIQLQKGRSNLAPRVPLKISLSIYIYMKVIIIFSSSVSQPHVNVKDAIDNSWRSSKMQLETPTTVRSSQ